MANPADKRLAVVAASPTSASLRMLDRQQSFHLQRNIRELVKEYELNRDPDLQEKVNAAVDADFPRIRRYPTPEDMEQSVFHSPAEKVVKFDQGQWCEFLGYDMKWHLAQVERVVRIAKESNELHLDKEPEWEYHYQFVGGIVCTQHEVRAAEEGLKRIFGLRPWLWQQWAILKTEEFCRFQELHERDFEMMSFTVSASMLFKQWLEHKDNKDFKLLYESRPAIEQKKLLYHLSSPFMLMDEIATKKAPGGDWSFKDSKVSIYMYTSVLGGGWFTAIVVLGIQLLIPTMMLYSAMVRSPRVDTVNGSDFTQFCTPGGPLDGLIVNLCVIVFYAIRQVPMVVYTFFETAGEADTPRSRLTSLRAYVWEQGRDTFSMQLGYKLNKYMNSTYIALVNNVMLFVLFLQDNPTDIILNAIAIEFVVYFAEEVAEAVWLDPNTRYLRAGAIELVMRSIVSRSLRDTQALCDKFQIDVDEYMEAIKEDGFDVHRGVKSYALAARDKENPEYNTPKDFIWRMAQNHARKSKNKVATWVFAEASVFFDGVSQWMSLLGINRPSIFRRYVDLNTWSRWDKILFMSPCSKVERKDDGTYETISEYYPPTLASVREELSESHRHIHYWNESHDIARDAMTRFLVDIIKTLTFQYYVLSLRNAIVQESLPGLIFRLVDGLFEWIAYFYLVIFPFTLIGYVILLLFCY